MEVIVKYAPYAERLRDALAQSGCGAITYPPLRREGEVYSINVWRAPPPPTDRPDHSDIYGRKFSRYPDDTVYVDKDGFTWGDRFQYNAPLDATVADVADRIAASLPGEVA